MSDNLPVVSGGGAVIVTGGGGAVAVSDQVGDLSVDRSGRGAVAGVDEAMIASLVKDVGLNEAQVQRAAHWFRSPAGQDFVYQQRQARDAKETAAVQASLRKQWGKQYEANLARIDSYLDTLPIDASAEIRHARDATGTALCNKSTFLEGLLRAASARRQTSTPVVQGDGRAEELAELNAKMADRSSDYWRGPNAERNQARYRELVDQGVTPATPSTADDAVGRRIAELEKFMGNRNSAYWRGPNAEALQREYRDLIDRRGGADHNRRR